MKKIILTILILASSSVLAAERAVKLDDSQNIVSSEVRVSEFDGNRSNIYILDIDNQDLVTDTDMDGLSDFIEQNIYFTDISKPSTLGVLKTDKVKLLLGEDPLSEAQLEVKYEDIERDSDAMILDKLDISEVFFIKNKISLSGNGLPNSLVTIFFKEINLVATVSTDSEGDWKYVLAKELQDEKYSVYLGIVNSEGSVVAKTEKILIKQKEGEVEMNPAISFDIDANDFYTFVSKYFWWLVAGVLMLGSLVAGILIAIYEMGQNKNKIK